MGKYKVGNELIIVSDADEDVKRLKSVTNLEVNGDLAKISWGLKILKVEYDEPNVTLTYRNVYGEVNKVYAVCLDVANFDQEKVLEKALLKAFQMEIMNISVMKNKGKI